MPEKEIKVLLVEDDTDYKRITEYMLQKMPEKVAVEHFWDLTSGLERVARGGIDIILLDLHLPDSAGIATLHTMLEKCGKIPVVVLTVMNDKGVAVDAVKSGAQDYQIKGNFDSDLLHRAIRYALARAAK